MRIAQDLHPRVWLAWTSDLRRIHLIIQSVEAEVSRTIVVVVENGEVIKVEFWDSVDGHRCRGFLKDETRGDELCGREGRWGTMVLATSSTLGGFLYLTRVLSFGWPPEPLVFARAGRVSQALDDPIDSIRGPSNLAACLFSPPKVCFRSGWPLPTHVPSPQICNS